MDVTGPDGSRPLPPSNSALLHSSNVTPLTPGRDGIGPDTTVQEGTGFPLGVDWTELDGFGRDSSSSQSVPRKLTASSFSTFVKVYSDTIAGADRLECVVSAENRSNTSKCSSSQSVARKPNASSKESCGIGSSKGKGGGRGTKCSGGGRAAPGRTTGKGRCVYGRGRSSVRGRGRSSGRGSGSSTTDPLSCLPEGLRVFSQGWEEITNDVAYEIVRKEHYNGYENNNHMCQIYEHMADRVVCAVNRKGLPLNTFNIFPIYYPTSHYLPLLKTPANS